MYYNFDTKQSDFLLLCLLSVWQLWHWIGTIWMEHGCPVSFPSIRTWCCVHLINWTQPIVLLFFIITRLGVWLMTHWIPNDVLLWVNNTLMSYIAVCLVDGYVYRNFHLKPMNTNNGWKQRNTIHHQVLSLCGWYGPATHLSVFLRNIFSRLSTNDTGVAPPPPSLSMTHQR